ncbi:hypothetical protein C8J57DRAFT_1312744 [Mycena rebaudengoi]|nr:hypothetical protein C8J57DRAFT_1312744 [Mycena rebaudengoi]
MHSHYAMIQQAILLILLMKPSCCHRLLRVRVYLPMAVGRKRWGLSIVVALQWSAHGIRRVRLIENYRRTLHSASDDRFGAGW